MIKRDCVHIKLVGRDKFRMPYGVDTSKKYECELGLMLDEQEIPMGGCPSNCPNIERKLEYPNSSIIYYIIVIATVVPQCIFSPA